MTGIYLWSWGLAVTLAGLVAGFMVSHSLVLGRFFTWLVATGRTPALKETYTVFARGHRPWVTRVYFALCGLQTLAGVGFLAVSVAASRHVALAVVAALAGPLWQGVHFASGFGALELRVLRATGPVTAADGARFVAWNVPIHLFHAAVSLAGLAALLAVAG